MITGSILVVDDEAGARRVLGRVLTRAGHEVVLASDAFEAIKVTEGREPDVTLSDLKMPGMDGRQLLKYLRDRDPDALVVLVTGFCDVETAVDAMREGAFHFLLKPVDERVLTSVVAQAPAVRRLRNQARFRSPLPARGLMGQSAEMERVLKTVSQVAPTRATVLITGASGTGKELVAEAVHQASPRAAGPMVRVNCAALAESLLESELFGHERGAFTGAERVRKGRLEQADGGTLFLDEVGELSPAMQVKLLRFLQERVFERVGGNQSLKVDVRVVAATNRDLQQRVAARAFREDLFYRLNVVVVHLPPLRERAADIPVLARSFLEKFAAINDRPARRLDDDALLELVSYAWPGNVRELQNVMERAVVLANGDVVQAQHLPPSIRNQPAPACLQIPGASLQEIERHAILSTLRSTGGSTAKAADTLGVSIRKIQYRLQQYSRAPRAGLPPVKRPSP